MDDTRIVLVRCLEVLTLVKQRVEESTKELESSSAKSVLAGAADKIGVAMKNIDFALKWEGEYLMEKTHGR